MQDLTILYSLCVCQILAESVKDVQGDWSFWLGMTLMRPLIKLIVAMNSSKVNTTLKEQTNRPFHQCDVITSLKAIIVVRTHNAVDVL